MRIRSSIELRALAIRALAITAVTLLALGCAAWGAGTTAVRAHTAARAHTASSQTIGQITLSPQAATLDNPAAPGGSTKPQRIAVSLTAWSARGPVCTGVTSACKKITKGTFAKPITIQVYGPSLGVLTAEKLTISSPTAKIYFDYNGGYVANSIVVTAVSGHAFGVMSFQPKQHGFPGPSSLPFSIGDPARNLARGWSFKASVGGGSARYLQMDTGSRGVVIPTSALGKGAIGPGPEGQIKYTSDGKLFKGHYYLAPVTLTVGHTTVTTVPIVVLGIDKAGCAAGYKQCVPGSVGGVSMMGVGFDRGSAQGPSNSSSGERPNAIIPWTPALPPELSNAFLALTSVIQGSMHPGYIITSRSVTLGITAANESGFNTVALTPGGVAPGDWNTEPGCFSFPSISGYPPQCGTVLMDTGIPSAILGLSSSQRPSSIATAIPDGEQISIQLPTATTANPILSYKFTTGDRSNPMAPTSIRWAGGKAPFVNTGRDPISRYDYLFDAGSGKVGFKPA